MSSRKPFQKTVRRKPFTWGKLTDANRELNPLGANLRSGKGQNYDLTYTDSRKYTLIQDILKKYDFEILPD